MLPHLIKSILLLNQVCSQLLVQKSLPIGKIYIQKIFQISSKLMSAGIPLRSKGKVIIFCFNIVCLTFPCSLLPEYFSISFLFLLWNRERSNMLFIPFDKMAIMRSFSQIFYFFSTLAF